MNGYNLKSIASFLIILQKSFYDTEHAMLVPTINLSKDIQVLDIFRQCK